MHLTSPSFVAPSSPRFPFISSLTRLCLPAAALLMSVGAPAAQLNYDADGSSANGITDSSGTGWNTTTTNLPWYNPSTLGYSAWNNANLDTAVFGGGTSGTTGATTVGVTVGTVTAAGIIFNTPFAGTFNLNSGTITLAGATPTITVNGSAIPLINSRLVATSFVKNGTGTLSISNSNNSLGAVTIDAGRLDIFGTLATTSVVVNPTGSFSTHSNNIWTMDSLTYNSSAGSSFYSGGVSSLFTIGTGGLTFNAVNASIGINTDTETVVAKVVLKGNITVNENASLTQGGAAAGLAANRQLDFDGAARTVTVATGKNFTVAPVIQNGGLIKEGLGLMLLQGINTYAGSTVINAGTLRLSGTATLGATTNDTTVATGATLDLGGTSQTQNAISGGGTITNTSTTTSTLSVGAANNNITFDGTITGSTANRVSVTKNGTGSLIFTNASTYSGTTTLNAGTLSAVDNTVYSTTGQVKKAFGTSALVLNGGTLLLRANGNGTTTAETLTYGNNVTVAGDLTIDAARESGTGTSKVMKFGTFSMGAQTLTIKAPNSYTVDFGTGTLTGNAVFDVQSGTLNYSSINGGTNSITKSGAGRLTIRAGTYGDVFATAGITDLYGTTVSKNVFVSGTGNLETHSGNVWTFDSLTYSSTAGSSFSAFGASSTYTIGSGGINVSSNVTIGIIAQNTNIVSKVVLQGDVTITGNVSLNKSSDVAYTGTSLFDLDGGTRTFNVAASRTFNLGVVTQNGAITKTGAGIMALNQANTYTGNTTISAGTLRIGSIGSIDNSALISVAAGATFEVQSVIGGFALKAGQKLEGGGSITGNLTIDDGAILAPGTVGGDTTQKLTLSGGLTLNANSQLVLELSSVASDYDQIAAGGTFFQDTGAKIVVLPGTFTPILGQSYNLLDWVGLGTFSSNLGSNFRDGSADQDTDLDLPSLTGGFVWDISQFTTNGVITIAAVPEPSRVLLLMGAGLMVVLRRRRR